MFYPGIFVNQLIWRVLNSRTNATLDQSGRCEGRILQVIDSMLTGSNIFEKPFDKWQNKVQVETKLKYVTYCH